MFTAQNALDELKTLTKNGRIATEQELRALAAKVSVYAEGNNRGQTTVYDTH